MSKYTMPNIAFVYHEGLPGADPLLAAFVAYEGTTHEDILEEVFVITNHVDDDWTRDHRVVCTGLSNRSTSAGDFVQIGIHLYRCDWDGWTHVAPSKWQLIKSFFV
jgi:hypothetical protein